MWVSWFEPPIRKGVMNGFLVAESDHPQYVVLKLGYHPPKPEPVVLLRLYLERVLDYPDAPFLS
jgi:hypothetical protein